MKNSTSLIIALVIIVFGALVSFNWELFQVDPMLFENGSSVFLKYSIIIIAVERAAQVYIGIRYETKKRSIKTKIASTQKEIKALETQTENKKVSKDELPATIKDLKKLQSDDAQLQNELTDHRNEVQRIALKVVFFAGIVLAIGGLSILNDMFYTPDTWADCDEGWCKLQMYLFRGMDILITGGLIGGGSKSFHQFLSNIDHYVESRKA